MAVKIVREVSKGLEDDFCNAKVVALDIEGVDLCREGRISLVQLSTESASYLLDMLDMGKEDPLVLWLKNLLESEGVVKVIHDCRMDSDALYFQWDIALANVHDTSCWNEELFAAPQENLNAMLARCGLRPNVVRDSGVYERNYAFWATRPLTKQMIEWASGDVALLLKAYAFQMKMACSEAQGMAAVKSDSNVVATRGCRVAHIDVANPGRFIGPRGSNLRKLERNADVLCYSRGKRGDGRFMVFYETDSGLCQAQYAAARSASIGKRFESLRF